MGGILDVPGLRGYQAGVLMGDQRQNNELQRAQGLLGILHAKRQQEMEEQMAPLKMGLLEAQVNAAKNPGVDRVDMGGSIGLIDKRTGQMVGQLPKSATPDAMLGDERSRWQHATPSGSAILGEQGSMQRHVTPSGTAILTDDRTRAEGAANRGVTMRGQNLTDARAQQTLLAGRAPPPGYRVTPDGNMQFIPGGPADPAQKQNPAREKELMGLDQQASTVAGALEAVEKTPSAFGLKRGTATMVGPMTESVAGRFDSTEERAARSYVFNVVSKVINERAGAAQSAQELARLRSFLPAEMDNSEQITDKLKGFQTYLGDMRSGTTGAPRQAGATGAWEGQERRSGTPKGFKVLGVEKQ